MRACASVRAPQRSGRDSDSTPSRPAALIPHCYHNKVAPRGRFSPPSTHQSGRPTLPPLPPATHLGTLLPFSLLAAAPHLSLPQANRSRPQCCELLPHTVSHSCPQQSIKDVCYQKAYGAAHGLHLNRGGSEVQLAAHRGM